MTMKDYAKEYGTWTVEFSETEALFYKVVEDCSIVPKTYKFFVKAEPLESYKKRVESFRKSLGWWD